MAGQGYDAVELGEIKYPFALNYFDQGCANSWFPKEIPLSEDVVQWEALTDNERHYITWMLGYFCTSESLVANNLVMSIYPQIVVPEVRLYLARQAYEEMNHTITFDYVIKTFNLKREDVYKMHATSPEMAAKEKFEMDLMAAVIEADPDQSEDDRMRHLIRNLVGYYIIMEGIFFFSGFVVALSFERQRKLKGLGTLVRYVLKDESIHLAFGADLISALIKENPQVMTTGFKLEIIGLVKTAVELETAYAQVAMPEGVLGLNKDNYGQYVRYLADRRLQVIGLEKQYGDRNPFKWLVTQNDMPELTNFFEAKTIDYEQNTGR